ncbi:NADPH--cytochrome P450 reductase [Labeo rohita]|uniref:NADPH--cytochrome P450 reductase n=1 Tax=Labeo rohita TaxID=84645 RepID=A0ABQ8LR91_LABRO|nr:NADPH--cytochrome P450 reductase [Labeo rohita]
MCAAISTDGLLLHGPLIGPYNTERLISFLDELCGIVVPEWFCMVSLFLSPFSPFREVLKEMEGL